MRGRLDGRVAVARRHAEDGAALVFVVLMMLLLLTLAHGALLAALSERAGSRMALRELRMRGAADHALATALARGPGAAPDSAAIWEERTVSLSSVESVPTRGVLRKLGPESWLVEGRAGDPVGVEARSARLTWTLDPATRVRALRGVATLGVGAVVTLAGHVDATGLASVRTPMQAGDCDPWQADLASYYAAAPPSVTAPPADSAAPLSLGLMDFGRLLDAAPVAVIGTGTPGPADALGACLDVEPWNWGDPDRPWQPCGTFFPLRASNGDLTVEGGAGQGILVVDGDLILTTGARYFGLAVVRGTLRLEGGSAFDGLAIAGDGLVVGAGSSLTGSACWTLRVLSANRTALGSFIAVEDSRIGPL